MRSVATPETITSEPERRARLAFDILHHHLTAADRLPDGPSRDALCATAVRAAQDALDGTPGDVLLVRHIGRGMFGPLPVSLLDDQAPERRLS